MAVVLVLMPVDLTERCQLLSTESLFSLKRLYGSQRQLQIRIIIMKELSPL